MELKQYFKKCKTLKQGTKMYRELMMTLHPDHGGDHDEVIEMQRQFEVFVKTATRMETETSAPETSFETKQQKRSQLYQDTLDTVLSMNVRVEPIGDFIWVFETSPFDTFKLSMLDFDYSKKHDGFYWTEIKRFKGDSSKSPSPSLRTNYSTNDLRNMFGSEVKKEKGYL